MSLGKTFQSQIKKHTSDHHFIRFLSKFDIIGLLETWRDFIGEFSDVLHGYTMFDSVRKRRKNFLRNSGSIAVFVRNSITSDKLVTRIYHNLEDCIVLYFKSNVFQSM